MSQSLIWIILGATNMYVCVYMSTSLSIKPFYQQSMGILSGPYNFKGLFESQECFKVEGRIGFWLGLVLGWDSQGQFSLWKSMKEDVRAQERKRNRDIQNEWRVDLFNFFHRMCPTKTLQNNVCLMSAHILSIQHVPQTEKK